MSIEDQDLVTRIRAGETALFEKLVYKYSRLAGAVAYGVLGDFHLAEDVVQEAFLKCFRALKDLKDPAKFKSWFTGIVRTRALDALRKRQAQQQPSAAAGEPADGSGSCEIRGAGADGLPAGQSLPAGPGFARRVAAVSAMDVAAAREERAAILRAITELPEADRWVIVLKHLEGLSYKEIAEVPGTSVSAIESRLFRARRALKKKL